MAQDVEFHVWFKNKDRKLKWHWQDYITLAYLLNNKRESQMLNSGPYKLKFDQSLFFDLTTPRDEKIKFGDAMAKIKELVAYHQSVVVDRFDSKYFPALLQSIEKLSIAQENLMYAEKYDGMIFVAYDQAVKEDVKQLVQVSDKNHIDKSLALSQSGRMQATGGLDNERSEELLDRTRAVNERKRYCWQLGRKCRIVLLQGGVLKGGANLVLDMFETCQRNSEVKLDRKENVAQLPVPHYNGVNSHSDLRGNFYTLLSEVKLGTIILDIDKLKTWPKPEFVQTVIQSVNNHIPRLEDEGGVETLEIIFCSRLPGSFEDICRILDKQLKEGAGEWHKTMQRGPDVKQTEVAINVRCGSLEQMKADALVCTMPCDLNLKNARASAALLNAAGLELQRELYEKHRCPKQLDYGEIAVVHGHELQCRYVLLGVMNKYEERYDDKEEPGRFYAFAVHDFIVQCLRKADDLGVSSLAFPAVGCGNLQYPVDVVADEMFRAVIEYGKEHPTSPIKHVMFVIFQKDDEALQVFQEKERSFCLTRRLADVYDANTEQDQDHDSPRVNKNNLDGGHFSGRSNKQETVQDEVHEEKQKHKLDDLNGGAEKKRIKTGHKQDPPDNQQDELDVSGEHKVKLGLPSNISKAVIEFFVSKLLQKYNKQGLEFIFGDDFLECIGPQYLTPSFETEFRSARAKLMNEVASDSLDVSSKGGDIKVYEKEFEGEGVFLEYAPLTKEVKFYGMKWSDIVNVKRRYKAKLFGEIEISRGDRHLEPSSQSAVTEIGDKGAWLRDTPSGGARQKTGKLMGDGASNTCSFSWSEKTKDLEVYTINKVTVKVYCADILDVPVDCIVNAANAHLQHGGGVAKYIAKAAGQKLTEDGNKYIAKHGALQVGEACYTTAGKLPYSHVIHTVGPCWSWYKPHDLAQVKKCKRDLQLAIKNSLTLAETLGKSSIAIPAVSAGKFGCPEEFCAVQYAKALLTYTQLSGSPLQEIHFIDKNNLMIKEIQKVFKVVGKRGHIPRDYDTKKFVKFATPAVSSTQVQTRDKGGKVVKKLHQQCASATDDGEWFTTYNASYGTHYPYCKPESTCPAADQIFTCFFSQNHKLLVYKGNILHIDSIDMIACTENVAGKADGFLSNQLYLTGKTSYQNAKERAFKHKKRRGDVVVCTAGVNKFKYVAHAILYMKHDITGEEDRRRKVNSIFRKLLQAMVVQNCKSLAMPLLGTGKGSADPVYYTQRLFESLHEFSSTPDHQMKNIQIHLVNIEQEKTEMAVRTIQKEVKALKPQTTTQKMASRRPKSAVPEVYREPNVHKGTRGAHSSYRQTTSLGLHRTGQRDNQTSNKYGMKASDDSGTDDERENSYPACKFTNEDLAKSVDGRRKQTSETAVKRKGNLMLFDDDEGISSSVKDVSEGISTISLLEKKGNASGASWDRDDISSSASEADDLDDCVICMDTIKQPKSLPCGHMFCKECIDAQFKYKQVCPMCGAVCGVITGDQPDGKMDVYVSQTSSCSGYEKYGRIQITYSFPNGVQQSNHPSPGKPYKAIRRSGYLPDNRRGRDILEMLRVAFDRKLVFTIGNSRTTGQQGVITWNDIHHKTDPHPHTPFGYPDPTYLDRVVDELKVKGVTPADIPSQRSKSTYL